MLGNLFSSSPSNIVAATSGKLKCQFAVSRYFSANIGILLVSSRFQLTGCLVFSISSSSNSRTGSTSYNAAKSQPSTNGIASTTKQTASYSLGFFNSERNSQLL